MPIARLGPGSSLQIFTALNIFEPFSLSPSSDRAAPVTIYAFWTLVPHEFARHEFNHLPEPTRLQGNPVRPPSPRQARLPAPGTRSPHRVRSSESGTASGEGLGGTDGELGSSSRPWEFPMSFRSTYSFTPGNVRFTP